MAKIYKREFYQDGVLLNCNKYHADGSEIDIEREVYASGELLYECPLVNGRRHGLCKYYENDERHGLHKRWFEDGTLKFEGSRVNGIEEGVFKTWWENGRLSSEVGYKNGLYSGSCRYWYENGNLQCEGFYIDGESDGLHREWFEDGNIMREFFHSVGGYEYQFRQWHENGELFREYTGEENSEYLEDSEPFIMGISFCIERIKQGSVKEWYSSGQPSLEYYIASGKLQGEYKKWLKDGQCCEQCYYVDGNKDGQYTKRFSNGEIAEDAFYCDGKFIYGTIYDIDGKIVEGISSRAKGAR